MSPGGRTRQAARPRSSGSFVISCVVEPVCVWVVGVLEYENCDRDEGGGKVGPEMGFAKVTALCATFTAVTVKERMQCLWSS